MDRKFKQRGSVTEIDDNDPFFEMLPETSVKTMEEMDLFADYVKSDMLIEVLRFLKFRAATRLVSNPRALRDLEDYMIIEILAEDEE